MTNVCYRMLFIIALLTMSPAFAQETKSAKLLKELIDEPSSVTSIQDAAVTLGTVVSSMKRVATGLKDKQQITEETLTTQSDVLKSLDQLIKLADTLPQNKRQQQSSKQPNGKPNPKPQQPDKSNENRTQQSQDRREDQQPQDSTDAVKAGKATADGPAQRRRIMVQEIWGHLPAAMQRRLMSGSKEKPLPKYQQLVEQYFQAIAEKKPTAKRDQDTTPAPKPSPKQ